MLRILRGQKIPLERFHEKFAVQLNDTHPAIAVAELMRLLVDEHGDGRGSDAWSITRQTFGYTNHTLLPEALERWPLPLFGRAAAAAPARSSTRSTRASSTRCACAFFGDEERIARLSLIDERGERYVRMAHLACVGSHAINGVAELHSELLKQDVLRDFHELWPEKFRNKTNGVTPRRWMVLCNPRLAQLHHASASATSWITRSRRSCASSSRSRTTRTSAPSGAQIKRANKAALRAARSRERTGVDRRSGSRCSTCR